MHVSVLMSVYKNDKAIFLKASLDSVLSQTFQPAQIVLVKDGPLTADLDLLIDQYVTIHPTLFSVISLKENAGLGNALNIGLEVCTGELIARMDSDDICRHDRLEQQTNFFKSNPGISVLGTTIEEFTEVPGDLKRFRRLPLRHEEIVKFSKLRNPLNHPTVMFRKDHVMNVGSYESVLFFEDYYLWLKMIHNQYKLANLDTPLLYFRVGGIQMLKRRHGLTYFIKELRFLLKAYNNGFISLYSFVKSAIQRAPLRLLPIGILSFVYGKLLRK